MRLSALVYLAGLAARAAAAEWCEFAPTIDANLAKIQADSTLVLTKQYLASPDGATPSGAGMKAWFTTKIADEMKALVENPGDKYTPEAGVPVGTGPVDNAASPVCVVVLGPSAVGKSFLTKNKVGSVLAANGITGERTFITVDGGLLREDGVLPVWDEIKKLSEVCGCEGFSDAYEQKLPDGGEGGIAKKAMSGGKTKLQKFFLGQKRDVIIPTTASDMKKEKAAMEGFASAGYRVLLVVVNADQANAVAMGTKRAKLEGKKYSGSSWMKSVANGAALINEAHAGKFGEFATTATHVVYDNNNYELLKQNGGFMRTGNEDGVMCGPGAEVVVTCNDAVPAKDLVKDFKAMKKPGASGQICTYSAGAVAAAAPMRFKTRAALLRGQSGFMRAHSGHAAAAAAAATTPK